MDDFITRLKTLYARPDMRCEFKESEIIEMRDYAYEAMKEFFYAVSEECSPEIAASVFSRVAYATDTISDRTVVLYTHPDNDELYFAKKFVVHQPWLVNRLIREDKQKKGVVLQHFLDNIIGDFDQAAKIYKAAKEQNAIKEETEVVITKESLRYGYEHGYVTLVASPYSDTETVCKIGEIWFYFAGVTGEEMSPEEYKKNVPLDDILREIFDTLESFRKSCCEVYIEEYAYYEEYIREMQNQCNFVESTLDTCKRIPYTSDYINRSPFAKISVTKSSMIEKDGQIIFRDDLIRWATSGKESSQNRNCKDCVKFNACARAGVFEPNFVGCKSFEKQETKLSEYDKMLRLYCSLYTAYDCDNPFDCASSIWAVKENDADAITHCVKDILDDILAHRTSFEDVKEAVPELAELELDNRIKVIRHENIMEHHGIEKNCKKF